MSNNVEILAQKDAPEATADAAKPKMVFDRIDQLSLNPPQWVVKPILEKGATAIWFGDPEAFKSFILVDLGMRVALGMDYHGFGECKQGSVVFLAGEGHSGFSRRVEAWCRYHNISRDGVPFYKSRRGANFMDAKSKEELKAAIGAALMDAENAGTSTMVIDTLARNLGGDENSNPDLNQLFEVLDDLRALYPDMTIIIVAHPGHDKSNKDRPRGGAALIGNTDAMAKIARAKGKMFTSLQCKKMKDAQHFEAINFQMEVIPLGIDEEGEAFSSLVAIKSDEDLDDLPEYDGRKKLNDNQRIIYAVAGEEGKPYQVFIDDCVAAMQSMDEADPEIKEVRTRKTVVKCVTRNWPILEKSRHLVVTKAQDGKPLKVSKIGLLEDVGVSKESVRSQ